MRQTNGTIPVQGPPFDQYDSPLLAITFENTSKDVSSGDRARQLIDAYVLWISYVGKRPTSAELTCFDYERWQRHQGSYCLD